MASKEICATGSNYEMGLTHGSKAKNMVAGTIDYYRQKFEPIWSCSWVEIKKFFSQYYDLIQANFPQYIEEMRGICHGSGQQFDDILAINCHYEIARKGGLTEHSCSVIGVESGRSADDRAYMTESWDYRIFRKHNTIILKLTLPNDTRIYVVTEAGIVGRMGFNSSGIGYCGNTLKSDHVGLKLPSHLMKRLIPEQHTLEDIRGMMHTFGTGSSLDILAGSSRDGIYDFEVDSCQTTELLPTDGLILHTDYFLASGLNTGREYIKYLKNRSVLKYDSLKQSLEHLERISFQDIKKALVQHGNHPHGVCTHADQASPVREQWATICSLVMDLTEQIMRIYEGNPCGHTYLEIKLPQIFHPWQSHLEGEMGRDIPSITEKMIIDRALTVPQLMRETSFTKRQIEYQLESISIVLADSYGVPKDKLLQASQPVPPETLDLLEEISLGQIRQYNFDHEEQQYYIFLAILCNQNYLAIFHLTDGLSVSKTTIQADMKDLRKNLEFYEIRIDDNRVYGYTLSGSPSSCLSFMVNGITDVHGPAIEHFFKKHSIHMTDHYIGAIRRITGTCGISFVESRLREFVYILVILSVSRQFPGGNLFKLPDFVSEEVPQLNEYKFAGTLLEELGLGLERDKIEYINAWLIGISVSDIENETPDKSYLVELLRQMLICFQALSGLQHSDRNKALVQLYFHSRPAFYKNLYHLPASNPLTRQILEQYATTATLVRETIEPLNYILYSPFAEDELAYLIVRFASFTAQKTYGSPYKKQGVIACNVGTDFSTLLKKQLASLFPEFDFSSIGYDGLCRELLVQTCHAVFTTSLGFQLEGLSVPIFYMPSILNGQGEYRLSQKVYQTFESLTDPLPSVHDLIAIIRKHAQTLSEGELRGDLISYFSQKNDRSSPSWPLSPSGMIRPALIQTRVTARTAGEAVFLSAQPLLACNYITQNYVGSVIDTSKSSLRHTVIMKSVALSHAVPNRGVLEPGISVTVLEHPVIFNVESYDPIRYIFCLNTIDYESHLLAMASLVKFLEDKQFYEILDAQSCSSIFNYLIVYGSHSS